MIRRKLFACTMMMTAGITSGFFVMEKTAVSGILILLVAGVAVCYLYLIVLNENCTFEKNRGKSSDNGKPADLAVAVNLRRILNTTVPSEAISLIAVMLMGFMLFTFSFISYEAEFAKADNLNSDSYIKAYGRILSVRTKGEGYRIEMSDVVIITDFGQADDAGTSTGGEPAERGEQKISLDHKVLIYYNGMLDDEYTDDPSQMAGRIGAIFGTLRKPSGADNPGCFDYRTYLRSMGTCWTFSAKGFEVEGAELGDDESEGENDGVGIGYQSGIRDHFAGTGYFTGIRGRCTEIAGRWRRFIGGVRENFLRRIENEKTRAFIKGVIFGDKNDIDDEVRDEFNANNTGHILAVSGLHIGFLYALLRIITRKRRSPVVTALIISVILVYGEMTLWSASTVRAVIVLSLSLMSVYVKRPFDLLSAVSAAAMIILISQPYQLFNTGFQMSFMALIGIAFLSGPLSLFVGEYLGVMLAVQIGTAPLAAFIFHRFNPLSILINIPVIAVASVMVPVCIIALYIMSLAVFISGGSFENSDGIAARVVDTASDLAIKLAEGTADLTVWLNRILAGDGGFAMNVASTSPGILCLVYCVIFFAASEWVRVMILRKEYRRIVMAAVCIALMSSVAWGITYNRFSDDEVVFVSVGQGDCTHIRAGAKNVLIDGGGNTERNIGKEVLMPYLLANNAERVELALVTHLHTDHYRGIAELAEIYPVGVCGVPSDYRKSIEAENAGGVGSEGDAASLANATNDLAEGARASSEANATGDLTDDARASSEANATGDLADGARASSEANATGDLADDSAQGSAGDNTRASAFGSKEDDSDKSKYDSGKVPLPEQILFVEPGSKIRITEDVWVDAIWPPPGKERNVDIDDPNENNMVFIVNYRGVKIIVTGDLLEEDEIEMVKYYRGTDVLDCDILKVAHHGSKSSSSEAFLDAVSPEVAVIEVGANNWYGHPHQQTLDRLEERGVRVYRTDLNGAVGIDIKEGKGSNDVKDEKNGSDNAEENNSKAGSDNKIRKGTGGQTSAHRIKIDLMRR